MGSSHSPRHTDDESWMSRHFKFLLTPRGAPPTNQPRPVISPSASDRSSHFDFCEHNLKRRSNSVDYGTSKPEIITRLRSKTTMEPSAPSDESSETQVELRTEGFQATLLWERIVSHLERTVKPGRHSYALRSYENCFSGHKVVDCLLTYMNSVLPKSIKKNQARLLAQKLLLTKVIEDARGKDKTMFRESKLYRFTGNHFWDSRHGCRGLQTESEVS